MPLIDIQVMEGVFTDEEKARMIEAVTEAFGRVAGGAMAEATSNRVHEIKPGAWGYGRRVLQLEDAPVIRTRET